MATTGVHPPRSFWQRVGDFWARHGFAISLLVPCTIYMLFFLMVIGFYLLRLSFTHRVSIVEEQFPSIQNYVTLATSSQFREALGRTIIFVLVGTPLQLIAGLVLAMLINRSFAGRGLVRSVFLLPVAIPALVTATIVAFMLFTYPFGHINDLLIGRLFPFLPQFVQEPVNWYTSPYLALGLSLFAKVWRDMPISMLILLAGLQSISVDQYEAAESMGSSGWQRFWYITIPMLVPAISTVLVLRSIEVWKEFIFPFVIAPTFPILGVMMDHVYHDQRNPPLAATIGLMLVILILLTRWLLSFITEKVRAYLVKT
jgi:ABC-type sugar transport system permease subunit